MKRHTVLLGVLLLAATAHAQVPNLALKDINGKRVALREVAARSPVLVTFWATWCVPCREELVHIQKLHSAYGDSGLRFLPIAIDDAKTTNRVKSVARGKRLTMPILLDPEQEAMRAFGLAEVPGVFILDRNGKLLYQHTGYKPGDEAQLEEHVRTAIRLDREATPLAGAGSATAPDTIPSGKKPR